MDIQRLLRAAVQFGASDLHIQVDSPPTVRVHGVMTAMNLPPVSVEQIQQLVAQIADKPLMERVNAARGGDFSYVLPEAARFRINVFYEQGRLCLVARVIPLTIKPFEELSLPPVVQEIAEEPRGLVLVTGTTGSGKSTTLAAMIDYLNRKHRLRIITVEDPIMRDTPVVRKLILEARVSGLSQAIAGRESGMQLFDQHLAKLHKAGEITGTEALRLATNPDAVALAMRGITSGDTSAGLVGWPRGRGVP